VGQIGVAQLVENLTIEGLVAVANDGRVRPWLAKDVTVAPNGLSIVVTLRANARFHDDSAISPQVVADTLRATLPQFAGPAYEDIVSVEPVSNDAVEVKLRRPSQFVLEALEAQIRKPQAPQIGTGSFSSLGTKGADEVLANTNYYLGAPPISRIQLKTYPSVRTAWAELLRDNIDMVYEVGLDELDSLQAATTINVFSFTRRYQYVVILNSKNPSLRAAAIRRALNNAIDRPALVRDAMGGHGVPSSGPVWPSHWAAQPALPTFAFDPQSAERTLAGAAGKAGQRDSHQLLRFTCLVASDAERVSLVVKRQLEAVGVEMVLQDASRNELNKAATTGDFDALITSVISGPSVFRSYLWWDSKGPLNRGGYANPDVDTALDQVRHALSDDEYRTGVTKFQQAILADPPAIFLAWDERARAVSKRFTVSAPPGTDIIRNLYLWRPAAGATHPGSN
jgi:peptide/nickel transport system substrate-binding protein